MYVRWVQKVVFENEIVVVTVAAEDGPAEVELDTWHRDLDQRCFKSTALHKKLVQVQKPI